MVNHASESIPESLGRSRQRVQVGLRHKAILPIVASVEIRRSVRLRNRLVMRLNCRPRHHPRPNFATKEKQPIQHRRLLCGQPITKYAVESPGCYLVELRLPQSLVYPSNLACHLFGEVCPASSERIAPTGTWAVRRKLAGKALNRLSQLAASNSLCAH